MRWLSIAAAFLSAVAAAAAASTTGSKVLVVLEKSEIKNEFTQFWADLENRGYKLTFETPKNDKLKLFTHGVRNYDHLVLFPPTSKGLGPVLTPANLLEYMKESGNIMVLLSSEYPVPTAFTSLFGELDVTLSPDRNSLVSDHFNYDTLSAGEKHDVVLLPRPDTLRSDVKNYFKGTSEGGEVIAFPQGVGHLLGNDSPLLTPILRAPRTAYAYNPKEEAGFAEDPFAVGQQLSLVSAFQSRNNARLTVVGAMDMLSNKWFSAEVKRSYGENGAGERDKKRSTVNREFAKELSAWTFQETGVLKAGRVEHHLARGPGNATLNPSIYRINSEVTYSIELSEYVNGKYVPYVPPADDNVQLEFRMLSPFHRLALKPTGTTANATIFSTTFAVPDQHGIFTFRVNYKRPFLSSIDEKNLVSVRHNAHNEWPRSWTISGGWVWIAGIWTTVFGFLAFVAVWLYSEPPRSSVKKSQ